MRFTMVPVHDSKMADRNGRYWMAIGGLNTGPFITQSEYNVKMPVVMFWTSLVYPRRLDFGMQNGVKI